jgi:hypothetical protein
MYAVATSQLHLLGAVLSSLQLFEDLHGDNICTVPCWSVQWQFAQVMNLFVQQKGLRVK